MLTLNNLKSPKGAHRNVKRLGRGEGSGQGKQAGKGHKGQKARSGGGIRLGFEGGQMPLYRRLPKRGFKNMPFKVDYVVVNLSTLENKFDNGSEVSRESLISTGLLNGADKRKPIKVLANGEFSKKFTFVGIEKFSKTALVSIENAGGTIVELDKESK